MKRKYFNIINQAAAFRIFQKKTVEFQKWTGFVLCAIHFLLRNAIVFWIEENRHTINNQPWTKRKTISRAFGYGIEKWVITAISERWFRFNLGQFHIIVIHSICALKVQCNQLTKYRFIFRRFISKWKKLCDLFSFFYGKTIRFSLSLCNLINADKNESDKKIIVDL